MHRPTASRRKRQHLKSRSGCLRCKSRKVKCGEERPSCQNCLRRGEECDFEGATTTSLVTASSASASSRHLQHDGDNIASLQGLSIRQHGPVSPQDLTMLDMELLHHYTISTSITISDDPAVSNYYQVRVPQQGFSHEYVLRCILALAASHLAHFRPESRQYYYSYARAQHTTATSIATPLLATISEAQAVPMYLFSTLTLFIAFGSLRDEQHHSYEDSALLPNWLALFRGVRTVLESNNRSIYKSSMAYIFYSSEVNKTWNSHQSDEAALLQFQNYLETSTVASEDSRQTLLDTFEDLRRALYFFYGEERSNEDRIRSLFTWMYRTSDDYHSLLRTGDYKALCILAFFAVLLHRLEYNWWFQGWGANLIDRIYTALDEVHRFWITWPVQQIGWIPKRNARQVPYYDSPSSA